MSYLLFRVPNPDARLIDGVRLGEFPDFDAALDARDDDVVAVLDASEDSQRVLVCHRIVGPDDGAVEQQYPVTSELDGPPASTDRQRYLADTRCWLAQIHTHSPTSAP